MARKSGSKKAPFRGKQKKAVKKRTVTQDCGVMANVPRANK